MILKLFILLYSLEYKYINICGKGKVQVKFTLEEIMKAWVGSRGIVPLFL
jgi:NhaP-type Na+/H+ or K+/H+ antiporter